MTVFYLALAGPLVALVLLFLMQSIETRLKLRRATRARDRTERDGNR